MNTTVATVKKIVVVLEDSLAGNKIAGCLAISGGFN